MSFVINPNERRLYRRSSVTSGGETIISPMSVSPLLLPHRAPGADIVHHARKTVGETGEVTIDELLLSVDNAGAGVENEDVISPEMLKEAHHWVSNYLLEWKDVDINKLKIERMHGGLTNILYKITNLDESISKAEVEYSSIILRIYGDNTEKFFSRVLGELCFTILAERGIGPKLMGIGTQGRLEEFIDGKTLKVHNLSEADISATIAKKMADLHACVMPLIKSPILFVNLLDWLRNCIKLFELMLKRSDQPPITTLGENALHNSSVTHHNSTSTSKSTYSIELQKDELNDDTDNSLFNALKLDHGRPFNNTQPQHCGFNATPQLAKIALKFKEINGSSFAASSSEPEGNAFLDDQDNVEEDINVLSPEDYNYLSQLVNFDLLNEVFWLIEEIRTKITTPIKFCHNDVNAGNIMVKVAKNKLTYNTIDMILIDFEYANYNYVAYDIANHFAEWIFDYSLATYPFYKMSSASLPSLTRQAYFIVCYLENVPAYKKEDNTGKIKMVKAYLADANQLILSSHLSWVLWSVIQAAYSTIDFPYLCYAVDRYQEYLAHKEALPSIRLAIKNLEIVL